MLREIFYRPRALADLDEIWEYTVDKWSEDQAVNYLSGLEAAVGLLADYPEISRQRNEFHPPVRIYTYRSQIVIFTSDNASLEIIRVLHSRSDWQDVLSE